MKRLLRPIVWLAANLTVTRSRDRVYEAVFTADGEARLVRRNRLEDE